MWAPKGLYHSYGFASCSNHGFSLGLALLTASSFPWQNSTFLACLTSWCLHCDSGFTLTTSGIALLEAVCRNPDPATHCQDLPLKSGWKPPWLLNSCILHGYNSGIMRMITKPSTQTVASPLWTKFAEALEYPYGWMQGNNSQGGDA
jgi:hypothetical protein